MNINLEKINIILEEINIILEKFNKFPTTVVVAQRIFNELYDKEVLIDLMGCRQDRRRALDPTCAPPLNVFFLEDIVDIIKIQGGPSSCMTTTRDEAQSSRSPTTSTMATLHRPRALQVSMVTQLSQKS